MDMRDAEEDVMYDMMRHVLSPGGNNNTSTCGNRRGEKKNATSSTASVNGSRNSAFKIHNTTASARREQPLPVSTVPSTDQPAECPTAGSSSASVASDPSPPSYTIDDFKAKQRQNRKKEKRLLLANNSQRHHREKRRRRAEADILIAFKPLGEVDNEDLPVTTQSLSNNDNLEREEPPVDGARPTTRVDLSSSLLEQCCSPMTSDNHQSLDRQDEHGPERITERITETNIVDEREDGTRGTPTSSRVGSANPLQTLPPLMMISCPPTTKIPLPHEAAFCAACPVTYYHIQIEAVRWMYWSEQEHPRLRQIINQKTNNVSSCSSADPTEQDAASCTADGPHLSFASDRFAEWLADDDGGGCTDSFQQNSRLVVQESCSTPSSTDEGSSAPSLTRNGNSMHGTSMHGTSMHGTGDNSSTVPSVWVPNVGGILGDVMGLGKTIDALGLTVYDYFVPSEPSSSLASSAPVTFPTSFATHPLSLANNADRGQNSLGTESNNEQGGGENLYCKLPLYQTLIVTTLTLIHQWKEELVGRFRYPERYLLVYRGSKRGEEYDNRCECNCKPLVVITNYETLQKDYDDAESPLFDNFWQRVLFDEGHMARNAKTTTFAALKKLNCYAKWCITGTPIVNYTQDIRKLSQIVTPGNPLLIGGGVEETRWKNRHLLRRPKEILSLPPITQQDVWLEMDAVEKQHYAAVEERAQRIIEQIFAASSLGSPVSAASVMSLHATGDEPTTDNNVGATCDSDKPPTADLHHVSLSSGKDVTEQQHPAPQQAQHQATQQPAPQKNTPSPESEVLSPLPDARWSRNNSSWKQILLMFVRLRQACNHPLLEKGFAYTRAMLEQAKRTHVVRRIGSSPGYRGDRGAQQQCRKQTSMSPVCGRKNAVLVLDNSNDPPSSSGSLAGACDNSVEDLGELADVMHAEIVDDGVQEQSTESQEQLTESQEHSTESHEQLTESLEHASTKRSSSEKTHSDSGKGSSSSSCKPALPSAAEIAEAVNNLAMSAKLDWIVKFVKENIAPDGGVCPPSSANNTVRSNGGTGDDSNLMNCHTRFGPKLVIFSQFMTMLDLIELALVSNGYSCLRIDGSVQGKDSRPNVTHTFNTDPAFRIILISLRAGGVGLNLTAAEILIHADIWWNLSVEFQASDRIHRIGQTKPVYVYRLLIKGSIEEEVIKIQERKIQHGNSFYDTEPVEKRVSLKDLQCLFNNMRSRLAKQHQQQQQQQQSSPPVNGNGHHL